MLTYNDIKLLNDLLSKSNKENKTLASLLNRYNIKTEAVSMLFSTKIYLTTIENFDLVDIHSIVTKGRLECAQGVLDILEYTLSSDSYMDSKQVLENRGVSYEAVKSLLNIDMHKSIEDVTYTGDSLYLRIASEINTEFKDARVEGSVEKRVSKILGLILRQVVDITDTRMSYIIDTRLVKNKSYKRMHKDTIKYTSDELVPTLSKGLEECENEIREAIKLLISKRLKQRKIYKLKSTDKTNMDSYKVSDLKANIARLYEQISLIDKKIDTTVKYCAYVISKRIEERSK